MLASKRILLIIAGGIAAYKSLDLIRRLQEQGASVRCILTAAATHFVTPLSVAALSGNKVFQDLFSLTDEAEMGHIQLSRSADLLVVAPATADLIARMAQGLASDLATTALLATDKPVLIAPAMNVRMWRHPATQRNLKTLAADGIFTVGPNEGDMACGEFGPGRMAEPAEILAAIGELLRGPAARPLHGCRALVTSGPTHEAIDPVRYIANRSSGKQGHAIAAALARAGAETVLVSGPSHEPDPPAVRMVKVESARDMLAACEAALPVDVAVCAAAVADWRVADAAGQKLKKRPGAPPALALTENPDILKRLCIPGRDRPALVVGFAAETERLVENAREKLARKGCDWIVANNVGAGTGTFGGSDNKVYLVAVDAVEDWPSASKTEIADRLVRRIADRLQGRIKA